MTSRKNNITESSEDLDISLTGLQLRASLEKIPDPRPGSSRNRRNEVSSSIEDRASFGEAAQRPAVKKIDMEAKKAPEKFQHIEPASTRPASDVLLTEKNSVITERASELEAENILNPQTNSAKKNEALESVLYAGPAGTLKKKLVHTKVGSIVFDPSRDKMPNTPYHDDGDSSMYSSQNVIKRKGLRNHPVVKKAIEGFMDLYRFDQYDRVTKDEYFRIHEKIAKYLRPDLNESGLKAVVENDWKHDSHGDGNSIDRDDLYNAIYELVDVWTPDIDVEEIVDLLEIIQLKYAIEMDKEKRPSMMKNPYDILI